MGAHHVLVDESRRVLPLRRRAVERVPDGQPGVLGELLEAAHLSLLHGSGLLFVTTTGEEEDGATDRVDLLAEFGLGASQTGGGVASNLKQETNPDGTQVQPKQQWSDKTFPGGS